MASAARCAATHGRLQADGYFEPLRRRLLEGRPFLGGRAYGLADVGYVPWIFRALSSNASSAPSLMKGKLNPPSAAKRIW